jgi:hypothetical protein
VWKLSEDVQALIQRLYEQLRDQSSLAGLDREETVVDLLDRIGAAEEPAAISSAAAWLFDPSHKVKLIASRAIRRLLSRVSPDQLMHLSGTLGSSWGWYISREWDQLSPAAVPNLPVDRETRTAVIGLLTFHRNGYVRQEAVRLLANESDGSELPFLLIRQNDWVNVISTEAQRAVAERLRPERVVHFARFLPLVTHLVAFTRRDLSTVFNKVVQMLVAPENDSLLADAVRARDRTVRREVVKSALGLAGEHRGRVVRLGVDSDDAMVRLDCAKRVCQALSGDELLEVVAALQRDGFMPVRREGFCHEARIKPDHAVSIWRRALLDRSASLGDLARFSIRQITVIDAAAFYRETLASTNSLAPLCGLTECGDHTDLPAFEKFLAHPQPRFRCAAIRGLARFAGERATDALLRLLRDCNPSVVREAKKQLQAFAVALHGADLLGAFRVADNDFARRAAIDLIFATGKWQSLPWLIRASSPGDHAAASLARRKVEAWFLPPLCNKVFTKPSADERTAIEESLAALPKECGDGFVANVRQWLEEQRYR